MINIFLDLDIDLLDTFGKENAFGHFHEFLAPVLKQQDTEIFIEEQLQNDLQDNEIKIYLGDIVTEINSRSL